MPIDLTGEGWYLENCLYEHFIGIGETEKCGLAFRFELGNSADHGRVLDCNRGLD